jgi:hypothetical protein
VLEGTSAYHKGQYMSDFSLDIAAAPAHNSNLVVLKEIMLLPFFA